MTAARGVVGGQSIAVVGLSCRYPDADDPPGLLDLVTTGRRAFRRIPPGRLDLADYYSSSIQTPDATYSTRAALIEGWQFDCAAFGVPDSAYQDADPAHWLALETAGRALAAAGFPRGAGLPADSAGVIIGNTLAGDVSRASALRLRWPYSRRALAEALFSAGVPADLAGQILRTAAARYLAPFPQIGRQTLAGSMPATVATVVGNHLGFRRGGFTVDGGGASSLVAVATACLALTSGELDVAVAGGVDISLDPLELIGMAKSRVLATTDMRVYDENPTGFLPGEGCGVVLLMRTRDARAAHLPVYAEILGWGIASAGRSDPARAGDGGELQAGGVAGWLSDADSQLLALRSAYRMARVDPAEIQLIEGSGAGTAAGDEAELAALTTLRAGARRSAALGSITANIGNTRAAAGAAGLIKTVLAIANGVLPPATGCRTPHPMLREAGPALRLPAAPERWPEGTRLAGVSAMGPGGLNVHLVLAGRQGRQSGPGRLPRILPRADRAEIPSGSARIVTRPASAHPASARSARARSLRVPRVSFRPAAAEPGTIPPGTIPPGTIPPGTIPPGTIAPGGRRPIGAVRPAAYLLHAPDRAALGEVLSRIAQVAPWLSDGEMQDLACQLAREAASQGPARVAIVATRQEQLARLASEAVTLLPKLSDGLLTVRPGIFAADGADGRVTLLFSNRPHAPRGAGADGPATSGSGQNGLDPALAALRWLGALGVRATAAVGHGAGELAGLVWAGCMTEASAAALEAARDAALALTPPAADAFPAAAIDKLAAEFRLPRRRLISGRTGTELVDIAAITGLLSADVATNARLSRALTAGAVGASLLLETGPGRTLVTVAGQLCKVPAVSLDGGPDDERHAARAAAALFAAGALSQPGPLFAGRLGRPVDIWREQIFIASPCQPLPQSAEPGPARTTDTEPHPGTRTADTEPGIDTRADDDPDAADLSAHPVTAAAAFSTDLTAASGADVCVAGVAPWSQAYVEELREPTGPIPAAADGPWRLHIGGCEPLRPCIEGLFRRQRTAGRTLAVLGDGPDDKLTSEVALEAARDAVSSGQLVVISHSAALTGMWASLHAEHPSLGVTVLRAPLTADGIRAARQVATVAPGTYRELVVDPGGRVREPLMVPVQLTGGREFPLDQDDVVLISRAAGPAGLVLAQVVACSGAGIAIIGRDHPEPDDEIIAALEQLRSAGARVTYEVVDTKDPAGLAAAVRRIERRLGPVTAVCHATRPTPRMAVAQLNPTDLRRLIEDQTAVLDHLVTAVLAGPAGTAKLRLIVTCGSVVRRYGLAAEGVMALASSAMAESGERLAASAAGCRALHVDWPAWSGAGLGERPDLAVRMRAAGFAPMSVAAGSRLLLKALTTAGLPSQLALHGRVGLPAPRVIAAGASAGRQQAGRFAEHVLVHYPGAELILEARLTLQADPYLADYRVDGMPVLPPAMALEALAQAASTLAGEPVRTATRVSVTAPVVLPADRPGAGTLIRICALRTGGAVTAVLRSEHSGFGVDHCRAVFGCQPPVPDRPRTELTAARRGSTGRRRAPVTGDGGAGQAEAVDGADLYGQILFQAGRFRRLAAVGTVTAHSATAIARGADELPWFGTGSLAGDRAGPGLLLGSPAITDASLQLVQACVPHRRLVLASCESVTFSGAAAEGAVTIRATEVVAERLATGAGGAGGSRPTGRRCPGSAPPTTARNRQQRTKRHGTSKPSISPAGR